MTGRITLAAIALWTLGLGALSYAQDDVEAPARRSPSLGERLQRFRQDLLGPVEYETEELQPQRQRATRTEGTPRKVMGPHRSSIQSQQTMPRSRGGMQSQPPMQMMQPQAATAPSGVKAPTGSAARGTTSDNFSGVSVPQRMESQGARPARAGANRGYTFSPVEEAARNGSSRGKRGVPIEPTADEASETEEVMNDELPSVDDADGPEMPADESESEEVMTEETAPEESADAPSDEVTTDEPVEETSAGDAEAPAEETTEPEQESTPEEGSSDEPVAEAAQPAKKPAPRAAASRGPVAAQPKVATRMAPPTSKTVASGNVLFTAQSPILAVEATGPRTVMIGKECEFTVKVRNSGAAANNVVVTVDIPEYADVASTQPTDGTATANRQESGREPLAWRIDQLPANSSQSLVLKLIPRKSAPLNLAMNYSFTPEASQTQVEVQEPKLSMAISGPTEVMFGESKIYKLTISNPGNGDCENVAVGLLPIGRSAEATQSHKLGTLKAGESRSVDIELTARQAGSINIRAQAFADGGLRADAAEKVIVRRAALAIDVEAPKVKYAGTTATYRITVANRGNATAETVKVAATLPGDAKFISATDGGRPETEQGRVSWSLGSLPAGGQRIFEMQCALSAPGDNGLQIVATGAGELSASGNGTTLVEAIADLKLEVRDPQGPIAVGDKALYEVHIKNRGTKAAEDVDVAAFFSEGLEAASAEGCPHQIGEGQVIFKPIASIAPGETVVLKIQARAETAGNHIFRAELNCRSLNTKLAAEEATHFYGDASVAEPAGDAPGEMPAEEAPETGAAEDEDAPPALEEQAAEEPAAVEGDGQAEPLPQ